MIYIEIFFCLSIPIFVSIVGVLLAYFFKSDPGFIYRELFGAKDFFHRFPKAYSHEVRKYLFDKRNVAFSDLPGEQIKHNFTVEVYEEIIKQIKKETRLLSIFWVIFACLSFFSTGIGFFMVNNKFGELISEINKKNVVEAYQSRNCLDYYEVVKNNKYFKSIKSNHILLISSFGTAAITGIEIKYIS